MSKAFKNKVKLNDWVNVLDFGAVGDGVTNDSAAFTSALITGKKVYVPSGTYLINVSISNKFVIEGAGSTSTIIKPFNTAVAAITFTGAGPFWTYHSEVKNIGFTGTGKVGIGFTFGATNTSSFVNGLQYANNVKFIGCHFTGLDKGVQFPFGNIGSSFYDCGFNVNRYGVYTINNKFGGDAMHAGNKYFFSCHFGSNDCGFYCHNTQDGFGGVAFYSTIFEVNTIATYIYTNNSFVPVIFDGCWNELNGVRSGTGSFLLDQWTGSVKSTVSTAARAHIFDGSDSQYTYRAGRVSDFYVKGTNIAVVCEGCEAEFSSLATSSVSTVDSSTSQIILKNPITDYGVPRSSNIIVEGVVRYRSGPTIDSDAGRGQGRWYISGHRYNKQTAYKTDGVSLPLSLATNLGNGAFGVTGTQVSDGVIYPTCTEWVAPFTSTSQYVQLLGSPVTTSAGWYVCTIDVKVVSGSPLFFMWDRANVKMATDVQVPSTGVWHTLTAIAYSPGSQTLYFDIGGTNASATIRASAFQMWRFDTRVEAEAFLNSFVYIEPTIKGTATYDPPSLVDGAGVTTTVTVNGAVLGDFVRTTFSLDLQGITLTSWVSAANTVSVRFQNESGGTLDLASGALTSTVVR